MGDISCKKVELKYKHSVGAHRPLTELTHVAEFHTFHLFQLPQTAGVSTASSSLDFATMGNHRFQHALDIIESVGDYLIGKCACNRIS